MWHPWWVYFLLRHILERGCNMSIPCQLYLLFSRLVISEAINKRGKVIHQRIPEDRRLRGGDTKNLSKGKWNVATALVHKQWAISCLDHAVDLEHATFTLPHPRHRVSATDTHLVSNCCDIAKQFIHS